MSKPLIAITSHSPNDPYRAPLDELLAGCVAGIEQAGGLPLLIPYGIAEQTVQEIVARCDGVLFTGGGDIAAEHYDGLAHPKIDGIDVWRDQVELNLVRRVVEQQQPFFGICRGSQVLNVAFGGSLHPEVGEVPELDRHTFFPDFPFDRLSHPVQIAEESLLAEIIGKPIMQVNSLHHQAIDRLAPNLRAVATAPDGMIEAVEVRNYPFGLAVQWHPEALPNEASSQAIFAAFVRGCKR
ncbi:MAG: gamma-glutamyl-gamma-aminobutyrate hydrolase family protein [Caldilineaceae bacterium]